MAIVNATDKTFDDEVFAADKPVLVDFWAPWCGPCVQMGPVLDELAETRDDIKIVKLNGDDYPSVLTGMGIMAFPTFLMVRNGQVLSEHMGMSTKEKFSEWIDEVVSSNLDGISREEYRDNAKEKAREQIEASNAFRRVNALIGSGLKVLGGVTALFNAFAFPPAAVASVATAFNAVRAGSVYNTNDGKLDPYKSTAGHIFSGITNFANTGTGALLLGVAATTGGIIAPLGAAVLGGYMMISGFFGMRRDFAEAVAKWDTKTEKAPEPAKPETQAAAEEKPACEGPSCELPGPK